MRVVVPFGRGNRRSEAIVLSVTDRSEQSALKCVESALDGESVLSPEQLKLALWMSDRFFCTVYDAVKAMLPSGMWFREGSSRTLDKTVTTAVLAIPAEEALILAEQKRRAAPQQAYILELLSQIGSASVPEILYFTGASRRSVNRLRELGAVDYEEREVFRRPDINAAPADGPIVLNAAQQAACDGLSSLMDKDAADAALLLGVTGSGKTAVYIRLIEKTISQGRDAIVLVPEIALTPQLIATFAAYFGDGIAVLHSALGIGERYDEWKRIRAGNVRVVVGTARPFSRRSKISGLSSSTRSRSTRTNPRTAALPCARRRQIPMRIVESAARFRFRDAVCRKYVQRFDRKV
jgi:primosomal protein N' (replication factor Y)